MPLYKLPITTGFTVHHLFFFFFPHGTTVPSVPAPPHYRGFTITLTGHTTLDGNPLDEGSVRSRDLYLTKHNTHERQTTMPPAGFEPEIPASERPQTNTLFRAATVIGPVFISSYYYLRIYNFCLLGCDVMWHQESGGTSRRNYGKSLPDFAASHSKAPQIFTDLNPWNSSVCLQSFYISTKRLFTVDICRLLF